MGQGGNRKVDKVFFVVAKKELHAHFSSEAVFPSIFAGEISSHCWDLVILNHQVLLMQQENE